MSIDEYVRARRIDEYHEYQHGLARRFANEALHNSELSSLEVTWNLNDEVSTWVTAYGSNELRAQLLKLGDWETRLEERRAQPQVQRELMPVYAGARTEWRALNYPNWRVHSERNPRNPLPPRAWQLLPIDKDADLNESLLGRSTYSVHPAATFVGTEPCVELMDRAAKSTPHARLVVESYRNAQCPPTLQRPALYTHYAAVVDRPPGARRELNLVLAMNDQQQLLCRQIYYNRLSPSAKLAVEAEARYGQPSRALATGEQVRGRVERVVLGGDGVARAVVRGQGLHIVSFGVTAAEQYRRFVGLVGKEVALERSATGLQMNLKVPLAREPELSRC